MDSRKAAFFGFLYTLPFIITNFIVALRIEPAYSLLGSFSVIRNSAFLPLILLLFFPIGAFITLRPIFQKKTGGKRKIYLLNSIVGVFILIMFSILFFALGEEFYRCEMLWIPNCD